VFGETLSGVRVLDVTRMIVGPTTTMLLADLGAEVIKVELPRGDDIRYMQTGSDPDDCPFFDAVNRNKQGIILNYRLPEGRELLLELAAQSDVFVHNYTPGVMEDWDLDYDAVRAVNPAIIYCSISAFGERGPLRQRPGTDVLFQAASGMMSVTGERAGDPIRVGAPIIDVGTGISAALAITAALYRRTTTSEGTYIGTSLFEQAVFLQAPMFTWHSRHSLEPPRLGNQSAIALIVDARIEDETIVLAVPTDKFWARLCEVLSVPGLIDDPRFATNSGRLENQETLVPILRERLATLTFQVASDSLTKNQIPWAPVQSYDDVVEMEQLAANGMLLPFDRSDDVTVRLVATPFRIGGESATISRPPPIMGRDTEEVLRTKLDLSAERIAELNASGITAPAPL